MDKYRRLTIPAHLGKSWGIGKTGDAVVWLFNFNDAMYIVPDEIWENIENRVMMMKDQSSMKIKRLLVGSAIMTRPDKRGRVAIPPSLLCTKRLQAGKFRLVWTETILMVFPLEASFGYPQSRYREFIDLRMTALYGYTDLLNSSSAELPTDLFRVDRHRELEDRMADIFNVEKDSLSLQILDNPDPDVSIMAVLRSGSGSECLWIRYDGAARRFRVCDLFEWIGSEFFTQKGILNFVMVQHYTSGVPDMADWKILSFTLSPEMSRRLSSEITMDNYEQSADQLNAMAYFRIMVNRVADELDKVIARMCYENDDGYAKTLKRNRDGVGDVLSWVKENRPQRGEPCRDYVERLKEQVNQWRHTTTENLAAERGEDYARSWNSGARSAENLIEAPPELPVQFVFHDLGL